MEQNEKVLIAILDDDNVFARTLAECLRGIAEQRGVEIDIHMFSETESIDKSPFQYDLLFFDVELQNENGIEWVKKWKWQHKFKEIVVASSYDKYVFDSLEVRPLAFVRKAYLQIDLEKAIDSYEREIEMVPRQIVIMDGKKQMLFNPDEIEYLRANAHYVDVVLYNGEQKLIRNKLDRIQKKMEEYGFVRIQISYLVNMKYVERVDNRFIYMKSGAKKTISPKYKDAFFDRLRAYIKMDEVKENGVSD